MYVSDNFKLVANELEQVRDIILEQTDTCLSDESLGRLIRSFDVRSGKMVRPALLLLCGACCGRITNEHIQTAAIVELLHNATLLHDDVIDEGQIRRGRETVNSVYGNEAAVLLGDFLLSRVFKMCSFLEPEIIKIISATAARICEGELRQTVHKSNWNLSQAEYIEIITEKTAALFSTCCRLGAYLASAKKSQIQALSDYGLNFGIAFQIADDWIDIAGDEGKSGKTLGTDVDRSKPTLPIIYILGRLDEQKRTEFIKELSARKTNSKKIKEVLKSSGSKEYVRNQIQTFTEKCVNSITDFADGKARQALIETACSISNATRAGQKQS